MYKPSNNPKVHQLTRTWKQRSYRLTDLKAVEGHDSNNNAIKLCAWCAETELKSKRRKYCSQQCNNSALAWARPQKEHNLNVLLARQNWKCSICGHDYIPLIEQLLINGRVYRKPKNFKVEFSYWLMKRIKQKSPRGTQPEVDHVLAICNGGLPLDLDNLRCLCYSCHKVKTKTDLSGKRNKK